MSKIVYLKNKKVELEMLEINIFFDGTSLWTVLNILLLRIALAILLLYGIRQVRYGMFAEEYEPKCIRTGCFIIAVALCCFALSFFII
jgi:hypothetical protein